MKPLHLYYAVKPLIPKAGHVALRRVIAHLRRRASEGQWPILDGSESAPPGWRGWPDGKRFCMVLTHDVESAFGCDQSLQLAQFEAERGFQASFNFVPERYDTPKWLRDALRNMGCEIGVHGLKHDGFLYRSRSEFRSRAAKINHYVREWGCRGFRSPYMHHDLEWLCDLDVDYDASTFDTDPFEPQSDGVGTIFPFLVPRNQDEFDGGCTTQHRAGHHAWQSDSYVELPYTLTQDSTMFLFLRERSIDIWKSKLDWIAAHGGMALLITHPDYMYFGEGGKANQGRHAGQGMKQYPVGLYGEFLDYVKERYAGQYWAALPEEVAEFWRENVATRVYLPHKKGADFGLRSLKVDNSLNGSWGGNRGVEANGLAGSNGIGGSATPSDTTADLAGHSKVRETFSCVLMGKESLLVHCGEMLLGRGHAIAAVVSDDPEIRDWAMKREIDVLAAPRDLTEQSSGSPTDSFDYLFSIGNLKVLPPAVLDLPGIAAVNYHDGLLPDYAGLNVPSRVLINQESEHGITWHLMEEAIDTGAIVRQQRFPVAADETAFTLNTKCFDAAAEAFAGMLDELEAGRGRLHCVPQDRATGRGRYFDATDRIPGLGLINWSADAQAIAAMLRALDFGGYLNPLTTPKLLITGTPYIVLEGRALAEGEESQHGSLVVPAGAGRVELMRLATLDGREVNLAEENIGSGAKSRRNGFDGKHVETPDAALVAKLTALDCRFCRKDSVWARRLSRLHEAGPLDLSAVKLSETNSGGSRQRGLVNFVPATVPGNAYATPVIEAVKLEASTADAPQLVDLGDETETRGGKTLALHLAAFLARYFDQSQFTVGFCDGQLADSFGAVQKFFALPVPWTIGLDLQRSVREQLHELGAELDALCKQGAYAGDIWVRRPELKELANAPERRDFQNVAIVIGDSVRDRDNATGNALAAARQSDGNLLTFCMAADGNSLQCDYDKTAFEEQFVADTLQCFDVFLGQIGLHPELPLEQVPILPTGQQKELLLAFNSTHQQLDFSRGIHQLIEEQARRTPTQRAVFDSRYTGEGPDRAGSAEGALTYAELNDAADRLAHYLKGLGLCQGELVGVHMHRSGDLIVALLAILKAGGAYLPLDPAFPQSRLQLMIEDAGVGLVFTEPDSAAQIDGFGGTLMEVRRVLATSGVRDTASSLGGAESEGLEAVNLPAFDPEKLCYTIYTSGSTGQPKGVKVTHRNVLNLFHEMDSDLDIGEPGTWLAVSSLSFDISVLELFWPLTRGYSVVVSAHSHEMLLGSGWFDDAGASQAATDALESESHAHASRRSEAPLSVGVSDAGGAVHVPDFSLFYFASDEADAGGGAVAHTADFTHAQDKYRLLLDGAKFGDAHGFAAVWTPERHFHAFGGLYPNPSVVSAALAVTTQRIAIRAGSCVLPLHHPARVAEEWALVDNLSGGRVGVSFAAGWQPNDFVIRPEAHAQRKELMFRDIEVVRQLWRGESVSFPGADGNDVLVATRPRPVQAELPTWVTVAGNPETFIQAGESGCFVLTHLLGQTILELESKIAQYRAAWRAAGHQGDGQVTLMLHTLVGDSFEEVKCVVHDPMVAYLRSAIGLIRDAAWTFPTFRERSRQTGANPLEILDSGDISEEDMDALLEHAFERYVETSGLFGTPESVQQRIDQVTAAGVNEIACLIDFGVPEDTVLEHLTQLNAARVLCTQRAERVKAGQPGHSDHHQSDGESIAVSNKHGNNNVSAAPAKRSRNSFADIVRRHGVTHFQCTPSMAKVLMTDAGARKALGQLKIMLVGGEELPRDLGSELSLAVAGDGSDRGRSGGRLFNVYGPTETTVWSSIAEVNPKQPISLGRPLANTQLYVLDRNRLPVPRYLPGELYIGGEGVTPGYHGRQELTGERFVANPLVNRKGALHKECETGGESPGVPARLNLGSVLYRTGDLVRFRGDNTLEFLGRTDFQVKVRGYRIELSEIESALRAHTGVQDAAVLADSGGGNIDGQGAGEGAVRLRSFLLASQTSGVSTSAPTPRQLREYLARSLPSYMIPGTFQFVDSFPFTPNGKLDRKALGSSGILDAAEDSNESGNNGNGGNGRVAPETDMERALGALFENALGVVSIGVDDDFFELGGHSLLAVQIVMGIEKQFGKRLALATLFRSPTVRQLARELGDPRERTADGLQAEVTEPGGEALQSEEHLELQQRKNPEVPEKVEGAIPAEDGWSLLVAINADAKRISEGLPQIMASGFSVPPGMFLFHSHGGNVLEYHPLVAAIDEEIGADIGVGRLGDFPIWALQAIGLNGDIHLGLTIEQMAKHYVGALRHQQPDGPYILGGFCLGGLLALEAAIQLVKAGESVPLVAMFNSAPHHYPRYPAGISYARMCLNRMRMRLALEWSAADGRNDPTRFGYVMSRIQRAQEVLQGSVEMKWEHFLRNNGSRFFAGRRIGSDARYSSNGENSRVEMAAQRSLAYIHRRLQAEHHQAYCRYQPESYDGRVLLIRAEQQPHGIVADPLLGWGDILQGQVELAVVPGFQQTMMSEPNVAMVARNVALSVEGALTKVTGLAGMK